MSDPMRTWIESIYNESFSGVWLSFVILMRITLYLFWTDSIWNSIGSNSTRKWQSAAAASPIRTVAWYTTLFPLLPFAIRTVLEAITISRQKKRFRSFMV